MVTLQSDWGRGANRTKLAANIILIMCILMWQVVWAAVVGARGVVTAVNATPLLASNLHKSFCAEKIFSRAIGGPNSTRTSDRKKTFTGIQRRVSTSAVITFLGNFEFPNFKFET